VGAFVVTAPLMAYRKLRQIPARLVIDILKGKVETEEGGIFTSSEEKKAPGRAGRKGETIDEYFYHINGRQLAVSNDGFKALAAGVRYPSLLSPVGEARSLN